MAVERSTVTVRVYATIGSDVETPEGFVEIGTVDVPLTFGVTKPVTRQPDLTVSPVHLHGAEIEATANEVYYAMKKRLYEPLDRQSKAEARLERMRTPRTLAEAVDERMRGSNRS